MPGAEPFARGRDADVYALGDDRVLRRYRAGGDVRAEAELMRYAAAHGCPVPTVHEAAGTDLVMERLDGPTLLAAVAAGTVSPRDTAAVLAGLHERLHRLPAPSGTPALTVVHGDLHPDNVVMTGAGPVLIDWRNAGEGPAALDEALTAMILGEAALDPGDLDRAALARDTLGPFVAAAPDPLSMLDAAIARRQEDPNLSAAEKRALPAVAELIRSLRGQDQAQVKP